MRENRPYGSEGGEQRYCSPTPIDFARVARPSFAWIPAYARTTDVRRARLLRRSGIGRSPDFARVARLSLAWIPAYAGTTDVRGAGLLRRSGVGRSPALRALRVSHWPGSRPTPGRQMLVLARLKANTQGG